MGKREKAHRVKVAKRNQRISQEKSKMQRVFDKLLSEQIEMMKNKEGLDVKLGENTLDFQVVETDEEIEKGSEK